MNTNAINNSYQITAIYRIAVDKLPHVVRCGKNTAQFVAPVNWVKVNAITPATLDISSQIENKERIFSAKLVFSIYDDFFEDGHFVYLVEQANGTRRLIGSDCRPFTTATTTQKTNPSGNVCEQIEVTIRYTSAQEIATLL